MIFGNKELIKVSLRQQKLFLFKEGLVTHEFDVSTAKNGGGEQLNSECTPRGMHKIYEKIGNNCKPNTVFVSREPTGEIYSSELQNASPERDWILTRILRLSGEEEGFNRGGEVDTLERMIYIHGSPEDIEMGVVGSHGCIRMRNEDIIGLFDVVDSGTRVYISD